MENKVLLATSDGFYYDGIPSQGNYTTSTSTTEEYVLAQSTEDVFKQIGTVLIVSQVAIVTLAVICILKGILNSINNKKIMNLENNLSGESDDKENAQVRATIPYYIFSIILFIGYGIINVIKNFISSFI